MKLRQIGDTPLKATTIGLGCNNFGLRMPIEDSQAVIHKALDLGINFFDTADVYGHRGGSETALGRYLGARRKDVIIASKFGNAMDDAGVLQGTSRRYIMQAVEASLKRLKTDWIDIYQLHRFDAATPLEETMSALNDLVQQGKVRYLGVSQAAAWQLVDMQWTSRHHGYAPLTTCEIEYSLLARKPQAELIPAMQKHGVALLPFYPLAGGFLTGKYKRGAPKPEGGRLTRGKRYEDMFMTQTNWTRLENLEAFAHARGHTLLELAFSWLAAQPIVATVIAGATQAQQLQANVKAADWALTRDELREIDRITA
ncbi:MAG: aldo/keto reductase [Betaproteobacteria bacterium]|nr:aldo/keto reductase [Betaproteobacteria bacterium]